MQKWTKKHARFVGRVIFANFLILPLENYKNIIKEVEEPALFKKLSDISAITINRLSKAKTASGKTNRSSKTIAEIEKSSKGFRIRYTYSGFNKIFLIDKFFENKVCKDQYCRSVLFRLRRISSRNELTHRIILGIIKHQEKYLSTGNPIDLAPLSQVQLGMDNSWVSRIVNRLSVITPSGEERTLKSFFLTQKDVNKKLIKQLLDKENDDIESGRLKKPLTDNQIRAKLENEYGLKLSRHSVGHCRKDMGIPPASMRLSGYKYPPLSANFSVPYPLVLKEVLKNAPESSGIYEFRLKGKEIEHPNGRTPVIYIGSTLNIKKRLREHLGKNSKNGRIRDFLKKYKCFFRYIKFSKKWKGEELRLYSLFVTTYGAPPKCNGVRPGKGPQWTDRANQRKKAY